MHHVQGLSRLLALAAVDAFVRVNDFKDSLVHLKDPRRARVSDHLLLHVGELDCLVELDLRVGHESRQRDWRPLCMHFAYSLLDLESESDLLIFCEFDDGDADLLLLIDARVELDRQHRSHFLIFALDLIENRTDMHGGDFHDLVARVLGLQNEVSLADLTILHCLLRAAAGPRVLKIVDGVADERYESDSLTEKLVMQN